MPQSYTIGIDCRMAGLAHAGIGRYVQELLRHLPLQTLQNREVSWILFFSSPQQAQEVLGQKTFTALRQKKCVVYTNARHYTLLEQLSLPFIFSRYHLDVLHVPHFNIPLLYTGKIIITIHDLLWHEHQGAQVTSLPGWLYRLKYIFYRLVVRMAIRKASTVLVPTQTVGQTILKYYPWAEKKIVVTSEGVDVEFWGRSKEKKGKVSEEEEKSPYKSPSSFREIVYVGSLYPHKNVELIIRALAKLPQYRLSIVGARSIFQERLEQVVQQQGRDTQVSFRGFLTDEQLKDFYSQVFAFVQPSLHEGFGLPGLEAMAAHVPVVVSDIPIFHEIYQNGVLYFNPHVEQSLVDTLQVLDTMSSKEKEALLSRAQHIAASYSWQKMAEKTQHVYNDALQGSRR